MKKDDFVRARTNAALKQRTEAILAQLGLNMTDAINMFLAQVALQNGLPFDVKIPNPDTLEAMKEAEDRKRLKPYSRFSALRSSLDV